MLAGETNNEIDYCTRFCTVISEMHFPSEVCVLPLPATETPPASFYGESCCIFVPLGKFSKRPVPDFMRIFPSLE